MSFSEMFSPISDQYQWDDSFHRKIGFDLFSSEMLGKQINLEKKKKVSGKKLQTILNRTGKISRDPLIKRRTKM